MRIIRSWSQGSLDIRYLPRGLFPLCKHHKGRPLFDILGQSGERIASRQYSFPSELQKGETSLVIKGRYLIVPIFGVIEPNFSNFGLFYSQGIREVVKDIEIFREISELLISLPPHQTVSAQFELLLTRPIHQIRSRNDL
jgi:hypothetical protein